VAGAINGKVVLSGTPPSPRKVDVTIDQYACGTAKEADGAFAFDNLPPGKYRLQIWHERMGSVAKEISVPDTGSAPLTVELKLQ
jgi:hypothetical protein